MTNNIATRVYIALGSNLDNPLQQIKQALHTLQEIPTFTQWKISRFYQSVALSDFPQPDFINAVASFDCTLSAHDLLKQLQNVEQQHKRVRQKRRGPRTLDLDILLFGDQIINTPCLIIPHPELTKRNFVLYPLADIAADLYLPDGTALKTLLQCCDKKELSIIES